MPNIENALNKLHLLDKQPNLTKHSVIAPPDLFTPLGPRLGTSGSMGLVPGVAPPPPPKKAAAPRRKAKPVNDSDDEEGAELLDDADEESHGKSAYDGSSDSSDDALLYPVPITLAPPVSKKRSQPESDEPTGYEARMRRLLGKEKGDFMPPALMHKDGPWTEQQVHDYQQTLAWLRASATTGAGTAQSTVRQLSIHTVPDGNIGDNYIKCARAYYGLMEYADCDVFDHVLAGAYTLKEKE